MDRNGEVPASEGPDAEEDKEQPTEEENLRVILGDHTRKDCHPDRDRQEYDRYASREDECHRQQRVACAEGARQVGGQQEGYAAGCGQGDDAAQESRDHRRAEEKVHQGCGTRALRARSSRSRSNDSETSPTSAIRPLIRIPGSPTSL